MKTILCCFTLCHDYSSKRQGRPEVQVHHCLFSGYAATRNFCARCTVAHVLHYFSSIIRLQHSCAICAKAGLISQALYQSDHVATTHNERQIDIIHYLVLLMLQTQWNISVTFHRYHLPQREPGLLMPLAIFCSTQ